MNSSYFPTLFESDPDFWRYYVLKVANGERKINDWIRENLPKDKSTWTAWDKVLFKIRW